MCVDISVNSEGGRLLCNFFKKKKKKRNIDDEIDVRPQAVSRTAHKSLPVTSFTSRVDFT